MGELIGYARTSTSDQTPALQLDALAAAGCVRVFEETASGAIDERPELERMLDHLREGDEVIVWRLDRLGRSLRHLIAVVGEFESRGIAFRSLTEGIDTSTAGGKLVFHVFGALAEFERELIRERTRAGLAAARARGRNGGRPRKLSPEAVKIAKSMYEEKQHTLTTIASTLGCSRATVYRALKGA